MKLSILIAIISLLSLSAYGGKKQLPEDGFEYVSGRDTGFEHLKAPSLYQTQKIVLTFDDGPRVGRTDRLLDILKKHQVKATFFVLTENITPQSEYLIERMIKEGHIVASHDHDHDNNNNESEVTFRSELNESLAVIDKYLKKYGSNQKGHYYRFPYGAYGKANSYHHFNVIRDVSYARYGKNCINFAFWDIDSADWGPTLKASHIKDTVMAHIFGGTAYKVEKKRFTLFSKSPWKVKSYQHTWPSGGGVVLLHDIHERSVDAAELIIKEAKQKNVDIVHLNQVPEYQFTKGSCF